MKPRGIVNFSGVVAEIVPRVKKAEQRVCFVEEKVVGEKKTRPFILQESVLERKEGRKWGSKEGKEFKIPLWRATTLRNKKSIVEKTSMNYLLSRVSRSFEPRARGFNPRTKGKSIFNDTFYYLYDIALLFIFIHL